ncbi:unnamed protein product [Ectocarpus fasciculatus]
MGRGGEGGRGGGVDFQFSSEYFLALPTNEVIYLVKLEDVDWKSPPEIIITVSLRYYLVSGVRRGLFVCAK